MRKPTEEWLRAINARFQREDIDPRGRPFRALEAFLDEFNIEGVIFPSEIADTIFNWFYRTYGEERYQTGPLFRGVHYMDSIYWPIYIPVAFGTCEINALECLELMPAEFRKRIETENEERWKYMLVWADCLDYAYGYDDIDRVSKYQGLALEFIQSGNKELQAAIDLLLQRRPNSKAIENCRMAVEIFLKAILIIKAGWDEKRLIKSIGHDLKQAAEEVLTITNRPEIQELKDGYAFFPQIDVRYQSKEWNNMDLWRGYLLAQSTATTFTRMFSKRDIRPQIFPPAGNN
jgi:HEPN domain-containing protein